MESIRAGQESAGITPPLLWQDYGENMNEHDQPDEQDGYETDAAGIFKG